VSNNSTAVFNAREGLLYDAQRELLAIAKFLVRFRNACIKRLLMT